MGTVLLFLSPFALSWNRGTETKGPSPYLQNNYIKYYGALHKQIRSFAAIIFITAWSVVGPVPSCIAVGRESQRQLRRVVLLLAGLFTVPPITCILPRKKKTAILTLSSSTAASWQLCIFRRRIFLLGMLFYAGLYAVIYAAIFLK